MQYVYVQYWSQETVAWEHDHGPEEGDLLDHTAGNRFGATRPGDKVLAVSLTLDRDLLLIGSLTALSRDEVLGDGVTTKAVLSQAEAEAHLGVELYPADHHIVGDDTGLPMSFSRIIPAADVVANVRFIGPDGSEKPPKLDGEGKIDRQTFRGVRQITAESAAWLENAA